MSSVGFPFPVMDPLLATLHLSPSQAFFPFFLLSDMSNE